MPKIKRVISVLLYIMYVGCGERTPTGTTPHDPIFILTEDTLAVDTVTRNTNVGTMIQYIVPTDKKGPGQLTYRMYRYNGINFSTVAEDIWVEQGQTYDTILVWISVPNNPMRDDGVHYYLVIADDRQGRTDSLWLKVTVMILPAPETGGFAPFTAGNTWVYRVIDKGWQGTWILDSLIRTITVVIPEIPDIVVDVRDSVFFSDSTHGLARPLGIQSYRRTFRMYDTSFSARGFEVLPFTDAFDSAKCTQVSCGDENYLWFRNTGGSGVFNGEEDYIQHIGLVRKKNFTHATGFEAHLLYFNNQPVTVAQCLPPLNL